MSRRSYGWRPDMPDRRDYKYVAPAHIKALLRPPSADLRISGFEPAIWDQLTIGSCTAHGVGQAEYFCRAKARKSRLFRPSRLKIYYDARVIEGTVKWDAGAEIRDGIKVLAKKGVCPEGLWPYKNVNIKMFKKPSANCYTEAVKHKALSYWRVAQTPTDMKECLIEGYPIVVGFTVYTSFDTEEMENTGIGVMPQQGDQFLGGHAVAVVGYNDEGNVWVLRNSWGTNWGQGLPNGTRGYFTLPYEYLLDPDLASDFWTVRTSN